MPLPRTLFYNNFVNRIFRNFYYPKEVRMAFEKSVADVLFLKGEYVGLFLI